MNLLQSIIGVLTVDYVRTMKFELILGSDFSEEFGTDDESILINEATVRIIWIGRSNW